jgi:3'-phosphoadenosine 5'-phosphosulfate sulfotransferase (PAPS reductase)/FAD synthetase
MKNSIFDVIDNSCKNKKIYIIDCYRTPIERKISSFFQNIKQVHIPNYANLTLNQIITFFNDKLVNSLEEYHSINEVMNHYNIPLWDKFDTNKGYNLIEKDNKVFIKILFNDIEKWDKLLSNILGKKITIFNDNLSENKNTYELYKQFKNNYKVPKSYINNVLSNDKHFKIYNTENEQNIYIKKWLNNSI